MCKHNYDRMCVHVVIQSYFQWDRTNSCMRHTVRCPCLRFNRLFLFRSNEKLLTLTLNYYRFADLIDSSLLLYHYQHTIRIPYLYKYVCIYELLIYTIIMITNTQWKLIITISVNTISRLQRTNFRKILFCTDLYGGQR